MKFVCSISSGFAFLMLSVSAQAQTAATIEQCALLKEENQILACLDRLEAQQEAESERLTAREALAKRAAEVDAEAKRLAEREVAVKAEAERLAAREAEVDSAIAGLERVVKIQENDTLTTSPAVTREQCLAIGNREDKIACFIQLRKQTEAELTRQSERRAEVTDLLIREDYAKISQYRSTITERLEAARSNSDWFQNYEQKLLDARQSVKSSQSEGRPQSLIDAQRTEVMVLEQHGPNLMREYPAYVAKLENALAELQKFERKAKPLMSIEFDFVSSDQREQIGAARMSFVRAYNDAGQFRRKNIAEQQSAVMVALRAVGERLATREAEVNAENEKLRGEIAEIFLEPLEAPE